VKDYTYHLLCQVSIGPHRAFENGFHCAICEHSCGWCPHARTQSRSGPKVDVLILLEGFGQSAWIVGNKVRTPSTKALILLAILSYLGCAVLMPFWYPAPYPVLAPDGSVRHGPDGKVLVYRDMTEFNRQALLPEILFFVSLACLIWLFARFARYLYDVWRARRARKVFERFASRNP
jgi:hypothetical protein